jgi:hypothetical protein
LPLTNRLYLALTQVNHGLLDLKETQTVYASADGGFKKPKRLTGDRRTGLLGVLEHTRQNLGKRRPDLRQLHTPSHHEHGLGGQFFAVDGVRARVKTT